MRTLYLKVEEKDKKVFDLLPGKFKMKISDSYYKGSAYSHIADVSIIGVSRYHHYDIIVITEDVFDPSKTPDELRFDFSGDSYRFKIEKIVDVSEIKMPDLPKNNIINAGMSKTIALIPLYDRVLVETDEQIEKTESGIIIPVESRKKSNTGTVVAVGGGTPATPMAVKPGDRVIYQRYAGLDVEWEGKSYTMVLAPEIIAIIDPKFNASQIGYKDLNDQA